MRCGAVFAKLVLCFRFDEQDRSFQIRRANSTFNETCVYFRNQSTLVGVRGVARINAARNYRGIK